MHTDTPLGRALAALEVIGGQPGISGAALAARLGVSPRAVRRAVATLREAGFSISSTPGVGGGYRLERGKRMPLVLTELELTSLAMALVEAPGTPGDEATRSVTTKVLHVISPQAADPARAVVEAAATLRPTSSVRPHPRTVLGLARAIEGRCRVEIGYRASGRDEATTRVVEPWSLVVRHRRWYLLALDVQRQATRTYRLDRVEQVTPVDESFQPPAGLDVVAVFEDHLRTSWRHATDVVVHAPLEQAQSWIPSTMGELQPCGPDLCRLRGRTNNCTGYLLDLLQLPFEVTIEGHDELVAAARGLASRLHTLTPEPAADPGSP